VTDILARRQLRTQVLQVLQAMVTGVTTFASPGTRDIAPKELPYVGLRCGPERKVSTGRTMPEFTTTATLFVSAHVAADTDEAAQDAIEALGQQLEYAILGAPAFVELLQQVSGITSETEISAMGSQFQAQLRMAIDCEVFEAFDPTLINPAAYPALQEIGLHVDTVRPYDADGVYLNPPFPAAVTPAPRTAGPDGRDEGAALIELPT
jgi:hypothetical protein